ncbi:hypothetical protein BZA77DRAFT_326532 [Pyronema omphalodes]|nr:hypothetical protein BZA77DRAFT_326532 [Pyronema omphalodes]
MYPKPVQRRAVIRMWRSFPWKWDNEVDVKKFVSKQLSTRYHHSKNYKEMKAAEAWYSDIANRIAAGHAEAVEAVRLAAAANPNLPVIANVVANATPSTRTVVAAALAPVAEASTSSHAQVVPAPAAAATTSTSAVNPSPVASPAAGGTAAGSPPATPSPAT